MTISDGEAPGTQVETEVVTARAHAYFDCVVHLGRHELARRYDDIFALLAGKVTVDVSRILEKVCGVALQELHVLQRLLKLLRLLDDLERVMFTA